jgi:hypothetical protein
MLCQHCLKSIEAVSEDFHPADPHHKSSDILHYSWSQLCDSVFEEECWLCEKLWESMEDQLDDSQIFLTMSVSYNKLPYITFRTKKHHGLDLHLLRFSTEGGDLEASRRLESASAPTLTMQNTGLWNHWYHTCLESHAKCRGSYHKLQPFAPDRLVKILATHDKKTFNWRLVHRTDIGNVEYLTLSHCWGASGHISLTKENYASFLGPTPDSQLPKTFQHAISITLSLGFSYIRIDSLCIIQDDVNDWKAQASMMGAVYENACCNIAATWAANGNDGCFTTRESRIITLKLGHDQSRDYHLYPGYLYLDEIAEAPLNKRGWVAQERFLAKKQLSFAKSQVYWECRELTASEEFPAGYPTELKMWYDIPHNLAAPPSGHLAKPTLDFEVEGDQREAWAALVDFYSGCKFSRKSDKMIALAGLAEKMKCATKDVYLAGHWRKGLERQLCWKTDDDVRPRFNRFRTPTYLAPTWSWASVDGPVMSDSRYYMEWEHLSCIEVQDVSVHSEHLSGLHSFVASSLVLRGIAVSARARRRRKSKRYAGTLNSDDWELRSIGLNSSDCSITAGTKAEVGIVWDENLSSSGVDSDRWPSFLEERDSSFLCMFVYIDTSSDCYVTGLVLRRLPSAKDEVTYVRMGIFYESDGTLFELLPDRLKLSARNSVVEDINLDAADLAGFVHTVTIV